MNTEKNRLGQDFCCCKCRCRTALVRQVGLSEPMLGFLAVPTAQKYYAVTCTLCGYTELYDSRVYANMAVDEPMVKPLPQEN